MVILMQMEYFAPRALTDVLVLKSENYNPHRYNTLECKIKLHCY